VTCDPARDPTCASPRPRLTNRSAGAAKAEQRGSAKRSSIGCGQRLQGPHPLWIQRGQRLPAVHPSWMGRGQAPSSPRRRDDLPRTDTVRAPYESREARTTADRRPFAGESAHRSLCPHPIDVRTAALRALSSPSRSPPRARTLAATSHPAVDRRNVGPASSVATTLRARSAGGACGERHELVRVPTRGGCFRRLARDAPRTVGSRRPHASR